MLPVSEAMGPRDRTLDIRFCQLIRKRLQMGDETPDIRLSPGVAGRRSHWSRR